MIEVREVELYAQSYFLGVALSDNASSMLEGLNRRFPLAWINRKKYPYFGHPLLKSISLTNEYNKNLAYCLWEYSKENEELRKELKALMVKNPIYLEVKKLVSNIWNDKKIINDPDIKIKMLAESYEKAFAFKKQKFQYGILCSTIHFIYSELNIPVPADVALPLYERWEKLTKVFLEEDTGCGIWSRNVMDSFAKMNNKTYTKLMQGYYKQYSDYIENDLQKYLDKVVFNPKHKELELPDFMVNIQMQMVGIEPTEFTRHNLTKTEIYEIMLNLMMIYNNYDMRKNLASKLFAGIKDETLNIKEMMEKDSIDELMEFPEELDEKLLDLFDQYLVPFTYLYVIGKHQELNREAFFKAKSGSDAISLQSIELELKRAKKELKDSKHLIKNHQSEINKIKNDLQKANQDRLKALQQDLVQANQKNKRLAEENESLLLNNADQREMIEELLLKVQEQEKLLEQLPSKQVKELNIEQLNKPEILIIGGHPHVVAKLRERLPKCKFCECRRTYKDDFFKGVKFSYVFVEWINHGMTGKLNKICPQIPKRVIASTNPDRILREMNEAYLADMAYKAENCG